MAVGVGGIDAAEVMAGLDWELKSPKLLGIHLVSLNYLAMIAQSMYTVW